LDGKRGKVFCSCWWAVAGFKGPQIPSLWGGSRRSLFLFLVGAERGEGALTEALEFLKVLRMKSKEVQ